MSLLIGGTCTSVVPAAVVPEGPERARPGAARPARGQPAGPGRAGELAPLHPRDTTFPAKCSSTSPRTRSTGAEPGGPARCPLEGLRERFLPEATFRGRQDSKFQYAVLAVAAVHGGTEPDLLDEVAWWQADDFWQYALFAAVAYIRAAASRAGVPVRRACQDLAQRPGQPMP
jgi:hypothetical protein